MSDLSPFSGQNGSRGLCEDAPRFGEAVAASADFRPVMTNHRTGLS
jgi:hypothetical protein